jgi:hypothetical protein
VPFRNGIKFTNIMGDYKGRVKLRQRKRRFAKAQRIKALAATKKGTTEGKAATPAATSTKIEAKVI